VAGALVQIEQTGSDTTATEGGATDTYSVRLTTEPTGPVYLTVSSAVATDQDRSLASESILVSRDGTTFRKAVVLVFDQSTWNLPQTVAVKAINDSAGEEAQGAISHSLISADDRFNGLLIDVGRPSSTMIERAISGKRHHDRP
jgi:hypothetical protein